MSSRLVFYVRHVDEVGHVHRVTVRSMSVALAICGQIQHARDYILDMVSRRIGRRL